MVGRSLDPLSLPFPVRRTKGAGQLRRVIAGRLHGQFEALTQRFGDRPPQFFGQVVDMLAVQSIADGFVTAEVACHLSAGLCRLL